MNRNNNLERASRIGRILHESARAVFGMVQLVFQGTDIYPCSPYSTRSCSNA
ncbi:Cell division protein FtsI (Peptidoglycan synthetase) [Pseudomonas chlororaphis]|uniref:Cell division protein FtsI (Peptidoglycan synthetase) n=1 Tax=Pseudomonas chlororaphis TaxID=587753 RepID=A0A3G7TSF9_9PSED|nr:Cell division protein FtsI (Peptidoglycan synthetase) [Pseudomonas chlororaphis]